MKRMLKRVFSKILCKNEQTCTVNLELKKEKCDSLTIHLKINKIGKGYLELYSMCGEKVFLDIYLRDDKVMLKNKKHIFKINKEISKDYLYDVIFYFNKQYDLARLYVGGVLLYDGEYQCMIDSIIVKYCDKYDIKQHLEVKGIWCNYKKIVDKKHTAISIVHNTIIAEFANPMPIGIADSATVYIPYKDQIFIIGGYISGPDHPSNMILVYNVKTSRWRILGKMPLPRWGASACYIPVNNEIYVIGGHNGKNTGTSEIQIYSVDKDKWDIIEMNRVFERGNMCVYNPVSGKIHVINYDADGKPLHYEIDPKTLKISSQPPPPYPVRWGVLTYYDNKLYLASGSNPAKKRREGKLLVFDPNDKKWHVDSRMPIKVHGCIREWGWLNNKLYSVYGLDDEGLFYSWIYRYGLDKKQWEYVGKGLIARDGVAGYLAKNGFLYIIGGRDSRTKPMGLEVVEEINIATMKIMLYSRFSDTYGFVDDNVEIIVLDKYNRPLNTNAIIYLNNEPYTHIKIVNGRSVFKPDEKGVYQVAINGEKSNRITII